MPHYKPLALEFTKYNHTFKQIYRDKNDFAIYQRWLPGNSYCFYEVFKVRNAEAYEIAGIKFEASEQYPGAERFGDQAYFCLTEKEARAKIKVMVEKELENKRLNEENPERKKRGRPRKIKM